MEAGAAVRNMHPKKNHMQSEQGACARCQAAIRYSDLARIERALRTKPWRLSGGTGGYSTPTATSGGPTAASRASTRSKAFNRMS